MGVGGLKCYVKNIITHTGASHTPNGGGAFVRMRVYCIHKLWFFSGGGVLRQRNRELKSTRAFKKLSSIVKIRRGQ